MKKGTFFPVVLSEFFFILLRRLWALKLQLHYPDIQSNFNSNPAKLLAGLFIENDLFRSIIISIIKFKNREISI
jgi:hypothetical protein